MIINLEDGEHEDWQVEWPDTVGIPVPGDFIEVEECEDMPETTYLVEERTWRISPDEKAILWYISLKKTHECDRSK